MGVTVFVAPTGFCFTVLIFVGADRIRRICQAAEGGLMISPIGRVPFAAVQKEPKDRRGRLTGI